MFESRGLPRDWRHLIRGERPQLLKLLKSQRHDHSLGSFLGAVSDATIGSLIEICFWEEKNGHIILFTTRGLKNIPLRLLGTTFTNAISCFVEPGPQEPYIDSFLNALCSHLIFFVWGNGNALEYMYYQFSVHVLPIFSTCITNFQYMNYRFFVRFQDFIHILLSYLFDVEHISLHFS
jgi:hypothetical protein